MMRRVCSKFNHFIFTLGLYAALFVVFIPSNALAAERYQILKIGDKDDYVLALQNRLYELGYFSGAATGYFGTKTQQAVIDYQTTHHLQVDGKAGPETLRSIMGSDFIISYEKRFYHDSNADCLQKGDKGAAVSAVQEKLKELGYYRYPGITGYYGPVTENAVRLFQSENGLKTDGIAGEETIALLNSGDARYYCIGFGDKGDEVMNLQQRLFDLGYMDDNATGYFDAETADALKEFQALNGLVPDAKCGKDTNKKLYSDSALRWDHVDRIIDQTSSVSSEATVDSFIHNAEEQLGKPYLYAAEGPNAFDCSGFVYYALRASGVSVKRTSSEGFSQTESWTKISDIGALIPGDLLFFRSGSSSRINHTGVYIGNHRFIHASSNMSCVTVSELTDDYERSFCFARRIF